MLKVTCDLSLFLKFLNCPVVDICYLFLLCMLFSKDKNPSFFFFFPFSPHAAPLAGHPRAACRPVLLIRKLHP